MKLRASARREAFRVREILVATVVITALMWGCVTAGLILVAGGALGHAANFRPAYFDALRLAGTLTGVAVIATRIWRGRYAWILGRAALWVEERVPKLQYALVTAVDADSKTLERVVREFDIPRVAVRAAVLAYARAAVAVVFVAFLLGRVLPLARDVAAGVPAPSSGAPRSTARASRLAPLRVHVTPPAYAHRRPVDLTDPSTVRALTGSAVTLHGPGPADGMAATLADSALPVRAADADGGWGTTFAMPARPTALKVVDGATTRIIVIDPTPDEPPAVVLVAPRADATVRRAPESIELEAEATDDIALADGYFEYIVSRGQSEGSFKSVTGTVERVTFPATRSGGLRATLPLGPLKLGPGSLLSIRAVARDGNTVAGPGIGVSDTRTLRVARPEEYDSLALAAAPPPPDEQAFMSQRMLVMETEALVERRKRMARDRYRAESVRLSGEEDRLKQAVDDILNGAPSGADSAELGEREDVDAAKGGAGSATASRERRFFAVAYQAMADAARSLAVGLPDTALPSARRALVALDSARVMNRLYLRGAPPKLVVDIGRVRLKGAAGGPSDSVGPGPRTAGPAPAADSVRRLVAARLGALVALSARAPAAAADSLTLLQVAALPADPSLAGAIGEAAAALRAARDARPALGRVRRAAAPPSRAASGLLPTTGLPPL